MLATMLARGVNSPWCTSMGRLFDAAGLLLGLGTTNCFEGQLPLAVEAAAWRAGAGLGPQRGAGGGADPVGDGGAGAVRGAEAGRSVRADGVPAARRERIGDSGWALRAQAGGSGWEADWSEVVERLADGRRPAERRAREFHTGLAELVVEVARRAGVRTVALSGGCFQNVTLLMEVRAALRRAGIEALCHRQLPPGDGGIAAGQALAVLWQLGRVELLG